MPKKKFKPGDVVQLNSGGPEMTVKCYDPPDGTDVTCTWFDRNSLQEKSFSEEILTPYEPSDLGEIYIG